ncbi:methyltransferase domain-containing protein [Candidatus Micrarchaeota archaeon]|nr:methyltransferase domain-containing protein [Candidatus Micrarchaeota archaeon]
MKKNLLSLLVCTKCRHNLKLAPFKTEKDEVVDGKLTCISCKREYPIINFIPRMLPDELIYDLVWKKNIKFLKKYGKKFKKSKKDFAKSFELTAKSKTSSSFGFEWKEFSEFHGIYKKQFLDWLSPFKPDMFKGKLVLDAGCGMGRHTMVASEYAKEIVGIDLSEAIDAAYKNLKGKKNVHLVQADIYNLPFKQVFDLAYSIGVIHHLPNPEKGFRHILRKVRPGGKIFVWIYGHEGNFVMVNLIEPFRKLITSRLPHQLLYYLCYPITALLEFSCAFYRVANALPIINSAAKYLPSNIYLLYISKFSFRHKLAIVFDFLSAPLARYYRKREFEKWFLHANLNAKIYPHNENSWKGLATVR